MEGHVQAALQLRLYVSAHAPESSAVEANLRRMCDEAGLVYEVEVLDVEGHPDQVEQDRIVLTPTLLRLTPPRLRVAGDLSDIEAALDGLGLRVWGQRYGAQPTMGRRDDGQGAPLGDGGPDTTIGA